MAAEKQYAVHDVDWTLWKGSLFTATMQLAARAGIIEPARHWAGEDPTPMYLHDLPERIAGRRTDMFDPLFAALATQIRDRLYGFTRPMLAAERQAGLEVVLASHSPRLLVEVFADVVGGVDHIIATDLAASAGRFTGEPIAVYDKAAAVGRLTLRPHVALGDTTHDATMLAMARRPLAVGLDSPDPRSLHPYIHQQGLAIPIIGEDHDAGLEMCERPLAAGGYGCAIRAVQLPEVLEALDLPVPAALA